MLSLSEFSITMGPLIKSLSENVGYTLFHYVQPFFIGLALFCMPIIFTLGKMQRTKPIFEKLYGKIEDRALNKFMLLALCFFLLIGTYWIVRVLKDALLKELVGFRKWAPVAKILSAVVTMAVLFLFNKFVYRFQRHRLFLIVGGAYSIVFLCLAFFYYFKLPIVGWLYYVTAESMGSILVPAVFWGFVVSTTRSDHARIGFPLISIAGQCGNVLGPLLISKMLLPLGYLPIMLISIIPLVAIPFIVEYLVKITPEELMTCDVAKSKVAKEHKTGAFEGLRLLVTNPYLIGILVVATFYEVVVTILEWMYKSQGETISNLGGQTANFGIFVAEYAQILGMVSLGFALFGTSLMIRRLGVRGCLIVYPMISALCILLAAASQTLGILLFATVTVKGFSYALNNPLKEFLYLPTSEDVKFKAKGFIDGLGSRASKASGSILTGTISRISTTVNPGFFLANLGTIVALSVIGVWAVVAVFVGLHYNWLLKKHKIVH